MTDVLRDYRAFIRETDEQCDRLLLIHAGRMRCRRGCCGCCTEIDVLPVEFYRAERGIAALAGRSGLRKPRVDSAAACGYLQDGACMIYPLRPLICRIHGFPLLYAIEDWTGDVDAGDEDSAGRTAAGRGMKEPERQLVFCDLNFTEVSGEYQAFVFGPGRLIDREDLNRRLLLINAAFLSTDAGRDLEAAARAGRFGAGAAESLFLSGTLPLAAAAGIREV